MSDADVPKAQNLFFVRRLCKANGFVPALQACGAWRSKMFEGFGHAIVKVSERLRSLNR